MRKNTICVLNVSDLILLARLCNTPISNLRMLGKPEPYESKYRHPTYLLRFVKSIR